MGFIRLGSTIGEFKAQGTVHINNLKHPIKHFSVNLGSWAPSPLTMYANACEIKHLKIALARTRTWWVDVLYENNLNLNLKA